MVYRGGSNKLHSGICYHWLMDEPVIIPETEKLPGSFKVIIKVRTEHTNGVMSVVEETLPPKALVPVHTHENDVWVYVMTGKVGVLIGETIKVAEQGEWALKPHNVLSINPAGNWANDLPLLYPSGTA